MAFSLDFRANDMATTVKSLSTYSKNIWIIHRFILETMKPKIDDFQRTSADEYLRQHCLSNKKINEISYSLFVGSFWLGIFNQAENQLNGEFNI